MERINEVEKHYVSGSAANKSKGVFLMKMKRCHGVLLGGVIGILFWISAAGADSEMIDPGTIPDLVTPVIQGQYNITKPGFEVLPDNVGFHAIRVTDNSGADLYPSLNNGILSWVHKDSSGTYQLYQWDVSKDVSTASKQTNFDREPGTLSSYGASAVWDEYLDQIKFWNGSTIKDIAKGWVPSLFDGKIAYAKKYGRNSCGIYYYNGRSTMAIVNNQKDCFDVSLYDGHIAWSAFDGHDGEIFYWDGSSVIQVTNNEQDDWAPSLYDGHIAWVGEDGHDFEIFYWDGSSIIQITNNDKDERAPSLYDGCIAWEEKDGIDWEIFYWDGEHIRQITDNDVDDEDPSLFGRAVAWLQEDPSGGDNEVYYKVIESPDLPAVQAFPAANVTESSATLSGTVNPNGKETTWHFEYGTSYSYGTNTSSQTAGNGSTDIQVEKTITGLSPSTTYYYRLVATNSDGTSSTSRRQFTTPPSAAQVSPPLSRTMPAEDITSTAATIKAVINPNGKETTYFFEYGLDTNYGSRTTTATISANSSDVTVTASLSNLQPATTYHYRVVATNSEGTENGDDKTFVTASAMPLPVFAPSSIISYLPVVLPVTNGDVTQIKPLGIGDINNGKFNLHIGLPLFAGPIDVYLAFYSAAVDPANFYLITPGPDFEKFGTTLTPFISNTSGPVDEKVLATDLDVSLLPKGTYSFYLAVTPHGVGLEKSYIWNTDMVVH